MTPDEFQQAIAACGLSLGQFATVAGLHPVSVRRMSCGMRDVPLTVQQWLRFAMAVEPRERALIWSAMLAGDKAAAA